MDALTKICSRCPAGQNVKPLSEFFKNKGYKDGRYPYCKTCHKAAESRPERVAKRTAYKAQYHIDHAVTINARSVQWGKDHPERMREKNQRSKKKRLLEQVAAGEREMPKVYLHRLESLMAGAKPCSQCGVGKGLGEFYTWSRSPDGVQAECKDCHNSRVQPVHERDLTIREKACTACDVQKPAGDFYDNPSNRDGMDGWCKLCRWASNIQWARANPARRKAISNKHAKKARQDPEKRIRFYANSRRWKLAHPEAVKIHGRRDRRKAKGNPLRMAKMREKTRQFFQNRPGYRRAASHKRRALLRNAVIIDAMIDIWVLYERDHGICTLCNCAVDRAACWPNLTMATIDHRIPLTRGGQHGYGNTKLAHHWCNSVKNNRLETPALLADIREQYAYKFLGANTQFALL
jgi:hypothetical protein